MFTHWSPIRSMHFMTCSSAEIRRRSVATGRLRREQGEDRLVDLEVAAVDAVVVGDDELRELDVAVLHRLHGAIERLRRPGLARRAPLFSRLSSSSW